MSIYKFHCDKVFALYRVFMDESRGDLNIENNTSEFKWIIISQEAIQYCNQSHIMSFIFSSKYHRECGGLDESLFSKFYISSSQG